MLAISASEINFNSNAVLSSSTVDTTKSGALFKLKAPGIIKISEIIKISFFSFESVETVVYVCISPRLSDQHQESFFDSPLQDHKTYFWNLKVLCYLIDVFCFEPQS